MMGPIRAGKIFLLALGLVLVGADLDPRGRAVAAAPPAPLTQLVKEVNEHFTLQGKPRHPRLVEKFQTWLSDSGPPAVITVDLLAAAQNDNEYYEPDVQVKDGLISCKDREGGSFSYRWLGTVRPGLHVVETFASGGGSGIFMDLYFFRLHRATGHGEKGPYAQLLMTLERTPVILGDRDDGAIQVTPGRVSIGKSRYRQQPLILEFK